MSIWYYSICLITPKLGDVTLELRLLAKSSHSQISLLTNSLFTHWRAGRMLEVPFVFLPSNPDHKTTGFLHQDAAVFALSFHYGSPGTRNCHTKQASSAVRHFGSYLYSQWMQRRGIGAIATHGFSLPGDVTAQMRVISTGAAAFQSERGAKTRLN